ncbi:MAG: sigma-70 family RNA polymerase sigma factor [Ruminiclostridium sp.]|nr:sigma-70 family RNA polymerase sigma factor [Ruminiclostridium sp.]
MDDKKIIGLYFSRDETAISETDKKYGKLCRYIAYHILYNEQDSEECVNDTYLRAWSNMPPKKPDVLSAFLGRITRNIALNRALYDNAKKRGGEFLQISDEALEIVSGNDDYCENMAIKEAINGFLAKLPLRTRVIFMRRYWYMSSIKEIAEDYGTPEGTVKSILSRTRQEFKNHLLKEGIAL